MEIDEDIAKQSIKALGGVDTLYFFADVFGELYRNFYFKEIKDLEKDDFIRISELYSLEYIGYSGNPNGFIGSFFRLYAAIDGHNYPVTRIGFKNPDKQRNVLNCYCQIEGSSIYMFGITKTLFYILEFLNTSFDCSVDLSNCQASRVDVNAFVNYDFSSINKENFRTRLLAEKDSFGDGFVYGTRGHTQTLYFGSRASKVGFKMYNKKLELGQNLSASSFVKQAFLCSAFGVSADDISYLYSDFQVWNIEFSFKREVLREFDACTVDKVLSKVLSLFEFGMDYVVFLGFDDEKIAKFKANNNQHLLKSCDLWQHIKNNATFSNIDFGDEYVKRVIKKSAEAHKEYYLKMIKAQLRHIREHNLSLTSDELLQLYYDE